MITLRYKCDSYYCENGLVAGLIRGKVDPASDKVPCPTCNGRGFRTVVVGAYAISEVHLGDHAESRTQLLKFDASMTVEDFLKAIFDPGPNNYGHPYNVVFTEAINRWVNDSATVAPVTSDLDDLF